MLYIVAKEILSFYNLHKYSCEKLIKFHEKKLGQLFCDNSAKDIIEMLITECEIQKVDISLNTEIKSIIVVHEFTKN